MVQAWEAWRPT